MHPEDAVRMKILDQLEQAMDQHDVAQYADQKEKKAMPEPSKEGMEAPKEAPKPKKEAPVYMDPNRQRVMDKIEARNDDPIMMRGQWKRA